MDSPFLLQDPVLPVLRQVRTDERFNRIAQELLDVPYLHPALTIAKEMRRFLDRDYSLVKVLLSVAVEAGRREVTVTFGDMRV